MAGDTVGCPAAPEPAGAPATRAGTPAERSGTPVAALAVRGLWKIYGPAAGRVLGTPLADLTPAELATRTGCVAAVRDVSFTVAAGEVFVVMGLSGSGKSTLVRCLTRLVEPTAGQVLFDGEDIGRAGPRQLREWRRHRFATVFQHFGLLPHRRVVDNVAFGLEIRGMGRAARYRRAGEVLDLVGLGGFADSYPEQLSGGMQQRVGLGRALASDPRLLFLDEPFSALDPLIRREMQNEVIRLHREVGTTMVFVTHDLSEALRLGDRILIMRDGRVVQTGRPDEVVGAPADDYVRQFVRDVPRAQVLTVRWVLRQPTPADPLDGPSLGPDVLIRDAVHTVLAAGRPVPVIEHGALLGVVDDATILRAVATTDGALVTTDRAVTTTDRAVDSVDAAAPAASGEVRR